MRCGAGVGWVVVTGKDNKIQRGMEEGRLPEPLSGRMAEDSPSRPIPAHHLWGGEHSPPPPQSELSFWVGVRSFGTSLWAIGVASPDPKRLWAVSSSVNPARRHTELLHEVFLVMKLRSLAGRGCNQFSVMLFSHIIPTRTCKRHN